MPKEEVVEMLMTAAKAIAQQQGTREELKQEIEKLPVSSRVRSQNLIKTAINRPTQKKRKLRNKKNKIQDKNLNVN
ncbi:hypothetical protein LYNGBM3L_59180 [Moorena producens 3L]|uniref:Uncharacterized protein n=2 Tax=Coleofasciculaceae TaxID=1892251 RepID=F4XZX3_9CYAN|nr:hypothetical protein LYNGBM3L_59180 [Moorena producens 3L]